MQPAITSRASSRRALPAAMLGALGLALVIVTGAWLLDGQSPPAIRLASSGASDAAPSAMSADGAAREADALWLPQDLRFERTDGAWIAAGEATAWQLQPPSDLEAAASPLAATLGVTDLRPSPHGEGLIAGDEDWVGPSLWIGPGGEWFYSATDPAVDWSCEQELILPVEPEPAPDADAAIDPAVDPAVEPDADGAIDPAVDPAVEPDADGAIDPAVGPAVDTTLDPAVGPDGATSDRGPCPTPTPPSGVPSAGDAQARAASLLQELPKVGTPTVTTAHADEWTTWVEVQTTLGGVVTDLGTSVGFGGDAVLLSANGSLARAVEMGEYPTIDADAAVARLQDQMHGGLGIARPLPAMDVAVDVPADALADAPVEDADEAAQPLPGPDVEVAGEPVTVTLVDVELVLAQYLDVEGRWWLLPAYRFTDADGTPWQVLAVTDDLLEIDDAPADGEPLPIDPPVEPPVEPLPSEPAPSEPGGGIDGTPGDGDEPVTSPDPGDGPGAAPGAGPDAGGDPDPGVGDPGDPGGELAPTTVHQEAAEAMVGAGEDEAIARAEEVGLTVRIVMRDGTSFPVTDDLRMDRVNFTIADGVVVEATIG